MKTKTKKKKNKTKKTWKPKWKNMKTKINNKFAKWKKMKMKMKKTDAGNENQNEKKNEKKSYFQLFQYVASRACHKVTLAIVVFSYSSCLESSLGPSHPPKDFRYSQRWIWRPWRNHRREFQQWPNPVPSTYYHLRAVVIQPISGHRDSLYEDPLEKNDKNCNVSSGKWQTMA